jgi:cathepsin L
MYTATGWLFVSVFILQQLLGIHSADNGTAAEWKKYKARHRKNYTNATQDTHRRNTWLKNIQMVKQHNEEAQSGKQSFTLRDNHLADLDPQEYRQLLGLKIKSSSERKKRQTSAVYKQTVPLSNLSSTVNWTATGWVNPVQDQGSCGACWSFAANGAMEAQYYNATRQSIVLSEQNLIDCTTAAPYKNLGCNGGTMEAAYAYVARNKGINTDISYPYVSKTGSSCKYQSTRTVGYVTNYMILQQSEAALQQAVAQIGPIAVGIDANLPSFQMYGGGLYNPPLCSPTS